MLSSRHCYLRNHRDTYPHNGLIVPAATARRSSALIKGERNDKKENAIVNFLYGNTDQYSVLLHIVFVR